MASFLYLATQAPQHLATMAEVDAWVLDQNKPQIFDDGSPENVLMLAKKRFAGTCAALAENGFPRAQEMSVFDFNSAFDYLSDKHKAA